MGTRTRVGVITLLLLVGAAACGGDDSGGPLGEGNVGADSSGGNKGSGEGDGAGGVGGDPCSLLEVSEIEAAFGEHGAVAEGKPLGFSCGWDVGDVAERGSGVVAITRARGAGSPEQSLAEIRDLSSNPIEVEGVGDEAFFDGASLWFRSGPITFSVNAYFSFDNSPAAESQEELTTLARHMLARS